MATITATESITLDGVMQAPGRPDEDTRGGFSHGGWATGYSDEVAMSFMSEAMAASRAMLFGRRTYEDLMGYWTSTPDPNPYTDHLLRADKYVASRSADTVLRYPASTLLVGEAADTVAALRADLTGSITILGSGELVQTLHAAGLVDQYLLQIHPIVLGSGTTLFAAGDRTDLHLERSVTTTTGVIVALFRK